MSYDVDIVPVPAQTLVVLSASGALGEIGQRMRRLREIVARARLTPTGPMSARFYDAEAGSQQEYDVCLPVQPLPDGSIPVGLQEAHAESAAPHHALQTEHRCPHDALQGAWRAVQEARAALGCTQSGPMTEVYVTGQRPGAGPDDYVTLVRMPCAH